MSEKVKNITTNTVNSVEFQKGKSVKSSYQALSDYTTMFFDNATWSSVENGKVAGLAKDEYEQLYGLTKGMQANSDANIKRIGNGAVRYLETLKKFPNNEKYLAEEIKEAQEKYNTLMKDKDKYPYQIENAKKELKLKRENIISSRTINEVPPMYY